MASGATSTTTSPRLALLQILVGADKEANLKVAEAAIDEAARNKSNIIALPECFNR